MKTLRAITKNDFLSVDRTGQLRTRTGEAILLRGVSLGGWLIQESWMCPVNGRDKFWANLDSLEESCALVASPRRRCRPCFSYQDYWLTEHDLDVMAGRFFCLTNAPGSTNAADYGKIANAHSILRCKWLRWLLFVCC